MIGQLTKAKEAREMVAIDVRLFRGCNDNLVVMACTRALET